MSLISNSMYVTKTVFELHSVWDVYGGVDGLTCNDFNATDGEDMLTCETLSIPACVDRTVYCEYPTIMDQGGAMEIQYNPD